MTTPSPRAAATALGLKRYQTMKLCHNGHNSPRYVSNHDCTECHDGRRALARVALRQAYLWMGGSLRLSMKNKVSS